MKLCIPTTDDRGLDAVAADHFGSAPFFTMVDLGTDEVRVVRNPACGHRPGECHHLDVLRAHHVQALACVGIGRRALSAVEHAGIRVLAPTQRNVAEIVEALRRGEVVPLTIDRACVGHHEGGADAGCGGHHRQRQRARNRHGHGHGHAHSQETV